MVPGTDNLRLPGEPVPDDELDPELIALPRKKPRVGPLLSLSILVLCAFLVIKLWPDFVFSRQADPTRYDTVAAALAEGQPNHFVEVRALPDLAVGAVVRKSKGAYGHRIQPALGSGGRLWLMTHSYHWHDEPAYDQRFRGRLAVMGELPFFSALRQDWAKEPHRRVVAIADLVSALQTGASQVRAAGGDVVELAASTPIELFERIPDLVEVTTYYTEELPDQDTWTLTLQSAGLDVVGDRAQGQDQTGESFIYRIRHPGGVEAVTRLLNEKQLFAARAEPIIREHRTTAGAVKVSDDGLELTTGETLEATTIEFARIEAPYTIGSDDRVIIATDRPDQYWYVTPLIIFLGSSGLLFAVLFGFSLWSVVRPARAEP